MRIPKRKHEAKKRFAYQHFLNHSNATGEDVNDRIFHRFGTRLNLSTVFRLRTQARKDANHSAPKPKIRQFEPLPPKVQEAIATLLKYVKDRP